MKVKSPCNRCDRCSIDEFSRKCAELRLSHQWSTKDVRHKVAEIVANHVKDANVDLEIKIFPSKSLFKPREQYKPLSRGQLDMTVLPLSYAGGQQPSYNLDVDARSGEKSRSRSASKLLSLYGCSARKNG